MIRATGVCISSDLSTMRAAAITAIKTGMIATGMVEITGSGIQPGLRVVTVG